MALPTKPGATAAPVATSTAPVAAAPVASANGETKVNTIKKFGPARIGEGETAVAVETPKAANLDLVDLSTKFYESFKSVCAANGIDINAVIAFASDADKSMFPGHKNGRIAYATCGTIASLAKINGLMTKVRGVGGAAALKAKVAEKDNKIALLEKQLADLMAKLGVAA